MTEQAYIGIGSNLDGPEKRVMAAIRELEKLADAVFCCSPLYRSSPMGITDQPDFINAVVGFKTGLPVTDLFDHLMRIERQQGRVRNGHRWGPRTLDLDILLYGEKEISLEHLHVPHPRIKERAFVLAPLLDIAPEIVIPGCGNAADLIKQVDLEAIARIHVDP